MGRILAGVLMAATAVMLCAAGVAQAETYKNGPVRADVGPTSIELSNSQASRTWTRAPFRTAALVDRRGADRTWSAGSRDFALSLGGVELGSEDFSVES